ncbi:MAG: D-cysteine desulfhydrase family protein [Chloroflexota bacterium]|nr:D-cysteine desulfhydrase family protein [Chloroflexota bacterium]
MLSSVLPRIPLAHLPTPLEELPRLRAWLQTETGGERSVPRLLVKRDDQTGLAGGGNKTRKLEYLFAQAIAQGADTVLTEGAPQSNHCRQTAAAAAKTGLRCILILGGTAPMLEGGNLLLDRLLGAEIIWAKDEERRETLKNRAAAAKDAGHHPFIVPYGGSNPVGAAAYAAAFEELSTQLQKQGWQADHVIVASSSGGTQAGLAVGARATGFAGQLHGISIDQRAGDLQSRLADLAAETAALLGQRMDFSADDFIVHDSYLGDGYGIVGPAELETLNVLAKTEGLLLDPVYTGRAMAGLFDLVRQGDFGAGDTTVFWHTGGQPALFAYAETLQA